MGVLYTIGYGNASWEDFEKAIGDAIVIDVRSRPYSKRKEFSIDSLKGYLGKRYLHMPELGGFDHKKISTERKNTAIRQIRGILKENDVVIMCAEADPNQCHRKGVALKVAHGQRMDVIHLRVKRDNQSSNQLNLI